MEYLIKKNNISKIIYKKNFYNYLNLFLRIIFMELGN